MDKLRLIISMMLVFCITQLNAQQKKIEGTVTESNGTPLPGVSVLIKGSNTGVTTDEQGKYQITSTGDVTLIFSLMGFTDTEINTQGKTRIEVTLYEESVSLGEVVVMGYNQVEKQHLASSISETFTPYFCEIEKRVSPFFTL